MFHWGVWGKVTDYCLYSLFGILEEGKVVKIIFLLVEVSS
jgi:hypothetical protein